jgi:hypothetical protein
MEEAELLLSVVEKCAGHHHKLGGIASEAMVRLLEINEECRQKGIARAKEAEAAEAERQAVEAQRQADEEEERNAQKEAADEAAREAAKHPVVEPRSIPRSEIKQPTNEVPRRI